MDRNAGILENWASVQCPGGLSDVVGEIKSRVFGSLVVDYCHIFADVSLDSGIMAVGQACQRWSGISRESAGCEHYQRWP